ncbi:nitroreductase family deazaflavin-dependent oxidoreductase [Actinospica durhamensis]|uniref:Nitroreductase family deazaflavin-dependent oxidoreductase n=1 Tax=Actinospica durhamensis TaxID=1508375 RepID=A0A941IMZ7_9ACTN|nr:nitroreductase family deazaflavin-dependent oxidoreductase [Actinospica durhamensis]MBR7833414.1 nitroreductase family deazaflavin-dependent oxidoreductase [Actinospica durhamensis]
MSEAQDWNTTVIKEFRENEGKVGGMFEGAPMILVHHTGAKSGNERVTPLVYFRESERIFIFASKGGASENPAWFHNLVANPKTRVEVGAETFEVIARVLEGAERDEYYAKQAALMPNFADYASKTTRTIPVIELERV